MSFDFDEGGSLRPTSKGFNFDDNGNLSGVGSKYGPKPPEGGMIASAKSAFGSMVKGAGQAAADFIPGVDQDNAVKRYGQSVIEANPTAIQSLSDIGDKPLTAVAEAVGNAGGSIGQMLGARALGQGITAMSPLAGPAAPAVALLGQAVSWLGPAAIAALPSYGGIRDKQILDNPASSSSWRDSAVAAVGAATVGAIESKFGPQQWALGAMTKEGRAALASKFAETTLAKGIGYGALKGAAIEGAEELVQNPVEQLAAYDNPTTAANLRETVFGGAMGAIGGGVLGGGFGAAFRSSKPADDEITNPNLSAQPQMRSFSDPTSPASQAGITPVVVPITPNPSAQVPELSSAAGGLIERAIADKPSLIQRTPDASLLGRLPVEDLQPNQPLAGESIAPAATENVANITPELPRNYPGITPVASTQSAPIGVTPVTQPAQPVTGEGAGGSQPTQVAPKPAPKPFAELPDLDPEQQQQLDSDLADASEREYQQSVKESIQVRLGLIKPTETDTKKTPFKTFLKQYGIAPVHTSDIAGKNRFKANNMLPATFRAGGLDLDSLVERAIERGFMTEADRGDQGKLISMIQSEIAGDAQVSTEFADDDAAAQTERMQRMEIEGQADKLGLPYSTDTSTDQLASMVNRVQRRMEKEVDASYNGRGSLKSERVLAKAREVSARIERKRAQYRRELVQFAEATIAEQDAVLEILTDDDGYPMIVRGADISALEQWLEENQQWDNGYGTDTRANQDSGQAGTPVAGSPQARAGDGAQAGPQEQRRGDQAPDAGQESSPGSSEGLTSPAEGSFLGVQPVGTRVYHVSPSSNRTSIERDGLRGNQMSDLVWLSPGIEMAEEYLKGRSDLDIWDVDVGGLTLREDGLHPGVAKSRTAKGPIPSSRLTLRTAESAKRSADVLTAPTRADVLAQQDQAEKAAKAKEAADRAADKAAAADEDRKRIAKASEAAAATFVLGGNALDNLTGQGGMFDESATPAQPADQATAILDAANITGKERIDALKDVKKGDITPDELQAAYPSKATPSDAELEDIGLLREFNGRWQYRAQPSGTWLTANSKDGALEPATTAYAAMPQAERLTRDQRDAASNAEYAAESDKRYGSMTADQLDSELARIERLIAENQKAGQREFNGNGGRRSSAAVSNEAARDYGTEKMRLQRYIRSKSKAYDAARAQVLINSIQEGESILQSGRNVSGKKLTKNELAMVQRSVDSSKDKLAELGEAPAFARAKAEAPIKNLVTLHNLTVESLLHAADIGGIPVPSIGITKVDSAFNGFGDITLIAPKGMIDPANGVPVYDRDAYTARYPSMNFKKVTAKKADAFYDRVAKVRELGFDGGWVSQIWEAIKNASTQNPDKVWNLFQGYEAPRLLYATEVLGKTVKIPMRNVPVDFPWTADKAFAKTLAELQSTLMNYGSSEVEASPEMMQLSNAARAAIGRLVDKSGPFADPVLRDDLIESMGVSWGNPGAWALNPDAPMSWKMLDKVMDSARNVGKMEVDRGELSKRMDKLVPRDTKAYADWAMGMINPLFDSPTITLRGREVEPTLQNVVDAMTIGATAGAEKTMTSGAGKTAAMLGKRFKSLAEIQAARDQVVPESVETEGKKATDKLLEDYRSRALTFYTEKDWRGQVDTWAGSDAAMDALALAGKGALTDGNIRLSLQRKGFKGMDQATLDLARQSIDAIRSTATNYFEAKPQRAVKLNEFRGAVVPKGTSQEVLDVLAANGIEVSTYNKNDPEAKNKVLEKLARKIDKVNGDVLFSRGKAGPDGKSDVLSVNGKFKGWPKFNTWTRQEYSDVVSLLPEAYRSDEHRLEPVAAKDWDALAAAVLPELEALNEISGAGTFRLDDLGNILVDERKSGRDAVVEDALPIAEKHGLGIFVTGVRTESITYYRDAGFVPELGLGAILARATGSKEPVMPMMSGQVNNTAYGTMMSYKPRGFPKPMFSLGASAPSGQSVADTQAQVNKITAKQANGPRTIVVATPADLPVPAPDDVRGLYFKGVVYVVASTNSTPREVASTLAHETIAHFGLKNMLGHEAWLKMMGNIQMALSTGNKPLNAIRDNIRKTYVDENGVYNLSKTQESDEITARAVEDAIDENGEFKPGFGFMKSVYAKLAQFLREMGFTVAFTNVELQGMLVSSMRNLETGARTLGGGSTVVAASRGGKPAKTETPEFRKWFGDSKVVGAQGDPLVVYHGTGADISVFDAGRVGSTWGADKIGFFFTTDTQEAGVYANSGGPTLQRSDGQNIIPAYLSIRRPVDMAALMEFTGDDSIAERFDSPIDVMDEFRDDIQSMLLGDPAKNWLVNKDSSVSKVNFHDGVLLSIGGKTIVVAVDPTQIKSATGNNGDFDGSNPDISFARGRSPQAAPRAPGMKDESRFMAVRRTLQDQFIQIRELQDMLTARGGVVGEAQDVYRAEERMHGRAQELLTDFANNQVQPLMTKIAKGKVELDELSLYAYAKHAKERNAYIESINPKIGDAGSGMSNDEADSIIQMAQASGNLAKFDELHQDLMGMTSTTRRVLLDEGLITQDEYDGWDGLYDNYVPLRGFENVTPEGNPRPGVSRGFSTTGKESIKALGRTSKAGDILENIIRDYERAVIRSEKNSVSKVFLDLALNNPDPDLWEIQPVKVSRSFNKAAGMVLMSTTPDTGDETIAIKVGGQQVRVKIKDPLILRAMKLAAKDETSQLERMLAGSLGHYTNLMRNTLTRYNPVFGAINAVRDVQMGAVSIFDELGAEGFKLYAKYYTPALAASFRKERNAPNAANPMDKWMMEMRFAGGTTGGFQMRDVSEITDSMRTMMLAAGAAPNSNMERIRGSKGYQGAAAAMKWLEIIGSTSEDAARLAGYRAAREMGKTPAEAASIAKNLTTNFNRKGEWGTTLNSLYLFFNAGVQGTTRVLEALQNRRVQYLMSGVTAAAMAIAIANAGAGDDDDGQAYWDKIPSFEKERNLIFMLPAGVEMEGAKQIGTRGRYIKIPMPYGLNVFPVLGNQLADLARYTKDRNQGAGPAKAAINIASAVFGSINPFGGGVDLTKPVEVGMAMAPTAADLAIQLMTGSNAFGRPVGPEQSPFDDKPDSENFSARQAGGASQYAARWLNSVTGGNEGRAGMIDVMPGTLDNVVRNATGGLGVFLADTLVNLPVKMVSPVETTNRDIPLWRNFYGQIDEVTDIGLFYDRRAEATKEMKQAKAEMKLGIEVNYSPESTFMQTVGNMAEGYTKAMTAYRKEEIRIAGDDTMTRAEKMVARRELEKQRAELSRDFNSDYVAYKREMIADQAAGK